MKRLCAWCGRELKQAKPSETDEATHGICTECRFKHFGPDEGKKADVMDRRKSNGSDRRKSNGWGFG